jgi:hypothetical protein
MRQEHLINNQGLQIRIGRKYRNMEISTQNTHKVKVIQFSSDSSVWAKNCDKCTRKICDESVCSGIEIPVHINRLFPFNSARYTAAREEKNQTNKGFCM